MSLYNLTNQVIHYHLHGVHGAILPHSGKILTLPEVHQKIKMCVSHILNLRKRLCNETGGRARTRNEPIKVQIETALTKLSILKIAKNCLTAHIHIPCILSCGHLANFPEIGQKINQGKSHCPLDGHLITSVQTTKIESDACVTFTFPKVLGIAKFYAMLHTPVSEIAETAAVCTLTPQTTREVPIFSLMPDIYLSPGVARNIQDTTIDSLSITISDYRTVKQSPETSSNTLKDIGVKTWDSLSITLHYARVILV